MLSEILFNGNFQCLVILVSLVVLWFVLPVDRPMPASLGGSAIIDKLIQEGYKDVLVDFKHANFDLGYLGTISPYVYAELQASGLIPLDDAIKEWIWIKTS